MFDKLFEDFVQAKPVGEELIGKYKNVLPEEIIAVWKDYGFGTFFRGFFKVIDPDEYLEFYQKSYFAGDEGIPIFATAFGDILAWSEGRFVELVKYKDGDFDTFSDGLEFFEDCILDEEYAEEYFDYEMYDKAVEEYGELAYGECFGYVPLLALGGSRALKNLKKVSMKEHLELIYQLAGQV